MGFFSRVESLFYYAKGLCHASCLQKIDLIFPIYRPNVAPRQRYVAYTVGITYTCLIDKISMWLILSLLKNQSGIGVHYATNLW